MTFPRKALIAASMFVAILSAASPALAIDRDNRCLVYSERYSIVEQNRYGLLFSKPVAGGSLFYGCLFSDERSRRLPLQDPLGPPSQYVTDPQLDGRYAGYVLSIQEPAGGGQSDIVVFDVRTGATKVRAAATVRPAGEPDEFGSGPGIVKSFVIKKNGSVAWIGEYVRRSGPNQPGPGAGTIPTERVQQVRKVADEEGTGNVLLETGTDIAPGSLAKSRDDLTIFWSRAGQPRSAPLR